MADPSLLLRGRVWYAWIFGKLKSTRCHDRGAAVIKASDLERRAVDPTHQAAHETTLRVAIDTFMDDRRITRGRSAGTMHCYDIKTRHLIRLLGEHTPLAHITALKVDEYIKTRLEEGASRNTLGKELTALRGTLKLAHRHKRFVESPAAVLPIGWSDEYEPRRRGHSIEQVRLLIEHFARDREDGKEPSTHRAAWVAFAVATAARRSEIERAKREDIRLRDGLVQIRGSKTKKSWRTIPILPSAGSSSRQRSHGSRARTADWSSGGAT